MTNYHGSGSEAGAGPWMGDNRDREDHVVQQTRQNPAPSSSCASVFIFPPSPPFLSVANTATRIPGYPGLHASRPTSALYVDTGITQTDRDRNGASTVLSHRKPDSSSIQYETVRHPLEQDRLNSVDIQHSSRRVSQHRRRDAPDGHGDCLPLPAVRQQRFETPLVQHGSFQFEGQQRFGFPYVQPLEQRRFDSAKDRPVEQRRFESQDGYLLDQRRFDSPNSHVSEQRRYGSPILQPFEHQRPDSPDGHHIICSAPDLPSVRYASSFPPQQRPRPPPVAFLPPKSPKRSATVTSLPLRSPKRTISFAVPNDIDPETIQEIHRHIVQMTHEAGTSGSVKIVEEHHEEEEPIPMIHLQDPPKPKFKRQLSADNSPPDKQLAPVVPVSTRGNEHVQQGLLVPSLAGRAPARSSQETSLVHPCQAGCHYTSSNMSPKRLKSEHGSVPCTPPRSPLVKQLATQVAETTLDRRGVGHINSKPKATKSNNESDVVHILPELAEKSSDTNNNCAVGHEAKDVDISHINKQGRDDTDSRRKSEGSDKYSSDVVSVLNPSQPKRTEATQTVNPSVPVPKSVLKPQESIQTLQMLFKRKEESAAPRKEQSPSANKACDVDSQQPAVNREESDSDRKLMASDMPSELPSPKKVSIPASTGSNSQTINTAGVEMVEETVMQGDSHSMVSSARSHSDNLPVSGSPISRPSTATKNNDDNLTDSDVYMAQLAGRLEDMQKRIFPQHQLSARAVYTDMMSAQTTDNPFSADRSAADSSLSLKEMCSVSEPDQTAERVKEKESVISPSDVPSTVTSTLPLNSGPQAEEESRTARLCRSQNNPFSFTPRDIEKAQAVLSRPEVHTAGTSQTDTEGKEPAVSRSESSPSKGDNGGHFRLGELWISSTREGQMNVLMKQRQLSDPGTFYPNLKPKPLLEKVKATTLRQFSEPAKDFGEFQKSPKQPGKSLQQQYRFRSETCEGSDITEGHTTFTREDMKAVSNTVRRHCPTSQGQVLNKTLFQRNPTEHFDVTRNYPPFADDPKREGSLNRDLQSRMWGAYHKDTYPWPCVSEPSTMSASWGPSPVHQTRAVEDRTTATVRPTMEDDNVFEDVSGPDRRSPFKNPALPVGYGDLVMGRVADRSSSSLRSDSLSPKRPALRSQSNVEQSPNKAELEAMAQYKYLRSFSEHISDPKRLMEQLRAMPPADCEQLMEQLQSMHRMGSLASFSSEKEVERPVSWSDRYKGARRILFQDEMAAGGCDTAEWQQQGCYTYPPPLARRQSVSSARDLRRSLSSIRDRDSATFSGVTRARQSGDIDVTVECSQASPASTYYQYYNDAARTAQHPETLRMKIETYIQQILQNHLQIRPCSNSQADMDLWIAQAAEIERLTQEASQLIETLSEHNRSVYDVMTGSVIIKVNCSTLLGVLDLWEKFDSGVLQSLVDGIFGGENMMKLTGLRDVELKVSVCYLQYSTCLEELGAHLVEETPETSPRKSISMCRSCKDKGDGDKANTDIEESGSHLVTPPWSPHCDVTSSAAQDLLSSPMRASPSYTSRSPSTPSKRQGKFTYGECPARKAFSELNLSDGELTPTSPTSKKFFDSFNKEHSKLSPITSPRSPRVLHSPTARGRASHADVTNEKYENTT